MCKLGCLCYSYWIKLWYRNTDGPFVYAKL